MTTKPPSVRIRDALRAAIRQHPDCATVCATAEIPHMTRAKLSEAAERLGIDVAAIAAREHGMARAPAIAGAEEPEDMTTTTDEEEEAGSGPDIALVEAQAIETEIQGIRGLILSGGFGALDTRLRELITEARKPPVTVRVEVPVEVATGAALPDVIARETGTDASWQKLFNVRGDLGKRTTALWDGAHPSTPKLDARYVWPQPQTALALTQVARGRNVFLYGPAGTGKTAWAEQLAAKTGRPFALISCDSTTDGPTLVGMTVPSVDGGVSWQDGQLTRAIQTAGCIICLDEPSVARPGALFAFQNVLQYRKLFITETGRMVKVAKGVCFIATDNTNGTGGGSKRGYTDTNRLNAAFLDRFGPRIRFDYLDATREATVLVAKTGCTQALAELLVNTAITTRGLADNQQLQAGIGLRRLFSWAEMLTDGITPEDAFNAAILNCAPEQDVETLRQQCLLSYDKATVTTALGDTSGITDASMVTNANDPAMTNPSLAGRNAAFDFANATNLGA